MPHSLINAIRNLRHVRIRQKQNTVVRGSNCQPKKKEFNGALLQSNVLVPGFWVLIAFFFGTLASEL
jgi:hypothetical protein